MTFANVSALVSQTNGPNGLQNGFPFAEDSADGQGKRRTNPNSAVQANGLPNGQLFENTDGGDLAVEELNAIRAREITSKAVSGILLMLLKWFKLSRMPFSVSLSPTHSLYADLSSDILKFEYLTQLLLDANYLPLIIKLFAHQDPDRAVEQRNDRADLE